MTILESAGSRNVPSVDNGWISPEPERFEFYMLNGAGSMPFPGWAAILDVSIREDVCILRAGDSLRAFEVGIVDGFKFWGRA